jgi:hypothetical protein
MNMAKKAKPARVQTWSVYRFAAKSQWLGTVEAATKEEALARAFEELNIRAQDRFKIVVQPRE